MTIDQNAKAGTVTLTLRGELDSATAPLLEDALADAIGGAKLGVVVVIATLDFIGAAGFRCLEIGQQSARARGRSFIVVANPWQLKIATVVGDLKLTIRLIEGPEGWKMRGPNSVVELGVLVAA